MLNLDRYGSRNNLNLQIFDYVSNTPIMTFDYAKTTTNEFTGETVYARGGDGNPKRIAWTGNRDSTLKVETNVFTLQHLSMLAGEPIKKGARNIYKSQVVTVEDDGKGGKQVTLAKTPVGGVNSVFVSSYVNGVMVEPQAVLDVTGQVVKLAASSKVSVGDDVEVYYQFAAADTASLTYSANKFPGYVKIVGDTIYATEKGGGIQAVQQVFHKLKLQPTFTVTYSPSGDPASLALTFDLFPVQMDGKEVMKEEILYAD